MAATSLPCAFEQTVERATSPRDRLIPAGIQSAKHLTQRATRKRRAVTSFDQRDRLLREPDAIGQSRLCPAPTQTQHAQNRDATRTLSIL